MEIERKFLIKEKEKKYPCSFDIEELKKEIKQKGKKIIQHYLPKELSKEIFGILGFHAKFKAEDFRIRKYGETFFITIKTNGTMKREEFEKKISKEVFEILKKLKIKTVEKIRLIKKLKNKIIEFDYFPKYSLITAEIEFNSVSEAEKFKTNMKEVTGVSKYKNQNLAK